MSCRYVLAPLAALLLVPALLSPGAAQRPGDWDRSRDNGRRNELVLLGSTRVGGFGVDRDVIEVARHEGRYSSISLQALENPVYVLGVTIVFANDEVQQIDLRQRLNPGEHTTPIYLQGRGLPIKRFEIAARASRDFHRRGLLNIYGELVRERENWELLGQNNIRLGGFGIEREVISVRRDARASAIVLEVSNNEVVFQGVTVFYTAGPPQYVDLRQSISAGGHTDPIPLASGGRAIERVELNYRKNPRVRGRAGVALYGLLGGGPPPDVHGRWEELGCQKASFSTDRDTVSVGRREGRFSAIRLRVERADVLLASLRVVYEHGPPDEYQVNTRIRAGSETQSLDLRGERRSIRQVDLVYSSMLSFKGSSRVCIDGRQ